MSIFNWGFRPQSTILAIFCLLFLASCNKQIDDDEIVPEGYPDALTIDNWEEFLDAPQDLIDELLQDELAANADAPPHSVLPPDDVNTYHCPLSTDTMQGFITAYDGSWRNLEHVLVSTTISQTVSDQGSGAYNYKLGCSRGPNICLEVNTHLLNGVTALDLLVVERHLQGIQPFTNYREMYAADVDGNLIVDAEDAALIRDAILGTITEFPFGNVKFAPTGFWASREAMWQDDQSFQSWATGNCSSGSDFHAVKLGDVNGTFNF